jgi:DNA modification methylase
MTITIKHGDCRQILKQLPDESVHCCVTSPPYFGLRDYGELNPEYARMARNRIHDDAPLFVDFAAE